MQEQMDRTVVSMFQSTMPRASTIGPRLEPLLYRTTNMNSGADSDFWQLSDAVPRHSTDVIYLRHDADIAVNLGYEAGKLSLVIFGDTENRPSP